MSEYQYYEFQAIDRPPSREEMRELRSFSTRARITPTNFINEYAWGSFKGDEDAWMEKYFDAFLYLANWGTHVFKVRLPARVLDLQAARAYCGGKSASVREKNGKVILSFLSDDEGGGEWVEGEGQLASLVSVRSELARGDLRALYLGWLLRAENGELDDDEVEPPVPPGLGELSGAAREPRGLFADRRRPCRRSGPRERTARGVAAQGRRGPCLGGEALGGREGPDPREPPSEQ